MKNKNQARTGYRTKSGESILMPAEFELQLRMDNEFTQQGIARSILKVGGDYARARGKHEKDTRSVWIPNSEKGRAMIKTLLKAYQAPGQTIMIGRKTGGNAGLAAHVAIANDDPNPVETFEHKYIEQLTGACAAGFVDRETIMDDATRKKVTAAKEAIEAIRDALPKATTALGLSEEDILSADTADLMQLLEEAVSSAPANGGSHSGKDLRTR